MRPEENRKYIEELVQRYDDFGESYKCGTYNEAQLRKEFIDVFFRALGWDVDNSSGYSDSYKEVVHEDPIKLRGTMGHIDYSFRIGGVRKFIVETKKPGVNIRDDRSAALQVRTYAWNARLPLNILTDFEEWAIYDCTKKPAPGDTAATARLEYFTYRELPEKWDHLVEIFSKERILQGSFDRFVASTKGKKGTVSVDKDILALIESWRELLARNLALRNPALSVDDLNIAVQRIIDRVIFLRICEDRGIETYETLKGLLDGDGVYTRLCALFERADDRYNSGLFHFSDEPGWDEMPDVITPGLAIDDRVLKEVIKRLYWPESQYEFSVIPPAILGQVYEQFLGKVIRLTEGHQARVEFKPEVKKAGGVFYTPEYIVDYIVKETVGRLVAGKAPAEVSSLRVLDPACGSGSFLLGAYQFLLDWHLDWYVRNLVPLLAEGRAATDPAVRALLPLAEARTGAGRKRRTELRPIDLPVYRTGQRTDERGKVAESFWRLSTAERKRILLNSIYGVDIDQQAVEVTKLSLLLKVLEDESAETITGQRTLGTERALPSLHRNVRCGNSLIGRDVLADRTLAAEEIARINPFDWERGFPTVMAAGGFDAVIGNPPYVRIQTMKEWAPIEVEHYKKQYIAASKGNYDIYVVFVERGLSLLNENGLLGYILPHKFFTAQYGASLRTLISQGEHVREIVHFGHQQVFENATTYTCLLFLSNSRNWQFSFSLVNDLNVWMSSEDAEKSRVSSKKLAESKWTLSVGDNSDLIETLNKIGPTLGNICHLFVGLQTDADDIFILEERNRQDDRVLCYSKSTGKEHWFEEAHLKHLLKGSLNIRRYHLDNVSKRLIFPYVTVMGKSVLLSAKEYQTTYPLTWAYLIENRKTLAARNKGKMGDFWYGYVYKKNHTRFETSKIVVPAIANIASFAPDWDGNYYFVGSGGGGGGGYGITILDGVTISQQYLLGVLNSSLSTFYLKQISSTFRGGYFALNRQYIEQIPIRPIDPAKPGDVAKHDRMVALVETMLDLHRRLPAAATEHQRRILEMQIEATDREIDALVYHLYGLTPDEIAVVQSAVAR